MYHLRVSPAKGKAKMLESLNENATRIDEWTEQGQEHDREEPAPSPTVDGTAEADRSGRERPGDVQGCRVRDLRH